MKIQNTDNLCKIPFPPHTNKHPIMIADIIGTIGVILCLTGYFLLQLGKLSPEDLSFSFFNLFGAGMILISLFYEWNLPAVLIESAWVLISLFGIFRILIRRRKRPNMPVSI